VGTPVVGVGAVDVTIVDEVGRVVETGTRLVVVVLLVGRLFEGGLRAAPTEVTSKATITAKASATGIARNLQMSIRRVDD
jgi:hypothetical protein